MPLFEPRYKVLSVTPSLLEVIRDAFLLRVYHPSFDIVSPAHQCPTLDVMITEHHERLANWKPGREFI